MNRVGIEVARMSGGICVVPDGDGGVLVVTDEQLAELIAADDTERAVLLDSWAAAAHFAWLDGESNDLVRGWYQP